VSEREEGKETRRDSVRTSFVLILLSPVLLSLLCVSTLSKQAIGARCRNGLAIRPRAIATCLFVVDRSVFRSDQKKIGRRGNEYDRT
jgi:hypothetical protein